MTPIFKKGDRSEPNNYRDVSIVSNLVKPFNKQLVEFFVQNDYFSPEQSGFLRGRSTTTNLLRCMHDWVEANERNDYVDVLYIDIRKAFNTVSHSQLLSKLSSYGVQGKLLKWIKEFLRNRRQRVRVMHRFQIGQPFVAESRKAPHLALHSF